MFGESDTDILIRSLEDRIENWQRCADGSLLIRPKNANFDELAVTFRKIFTDTEHNFIASVNLVKPGTRKAKEKASRIFEELSGLSFELKWKRGFVTRKPVLLGSSPPKGSDKGSRRGFEPATFLGSEKELMAKIQKLKPEELSINLVPLGELAPSNVVETRTRFPSSTSQSPVQVSWLVSITKIMYRSIGYASELRRIFDMLDEISRELRKISELPR